METANPPRDTALWGILASNLLTLSFIWSHWRSHVEHVEADLAGRPGRRRLLQPPVTPNARK